MASYGDPKQDVAAVVAKQMLAMARDAEKQYAEGYKAGRIAALREVGCEIYSKVKPGLDCVTTQHPRDYRCRVCRLLVEAESEGRGEQGEVGGDG